MNECLAIYAAQSWNIEADTTSICHDPLRTEAARDAYSTAYTSHHGTTQKATFSQRAGCHGIGSKLTEPHMYEPCSNANLISQKRDRFSPFRE